MNCCSATPGEPSVSRTRASRACSATRARSWITGWANRMIRSTRVPDAAATCSGVSPARMRAWMIRGGQLGAEVHVDLGEPAGVPAGGGAHRSSIGELEPLALAVGAVGGQDQALPVVGERHEAQRAHGRPPADGARSGPETRPEPEAIGARGAGRAGGPAWRVRTAVATPREAVPEPRDSADEERCHLFATCGLGTVPRRANRRTTRGGAMASPLTDRRSAVAAAAPAARRTASRRAVAEIAGAPGAWCPALSPGRRPRRLRHRPLGHPAAGGRRRSTAATLAGRALRAGRGGRLGRLVAGRRLAGLPGQPRRLDLRRAARRPPRRQRAPRGRRRGPARHRLRRRLDRPGLLRLLDRPRRRTGRRRRAGRRRHRRAAHAGHRRLPVGHLGVRRRALRAGPPRPARLPAHRRRSTSPPASSAGCSRLDAPGGIASEDGRFAPDGRSVYVRASLPGAPGRRPRRAGRGPAVRRRRPGRGLGRPPPAGRRPRRVRAARRRHRARRVERRRDHRAAACTRSPTASVVRADRRCPSR